MCKLLLITILTSLLTACSLGGAPVPADHFYRIPEIIIETQVKPGIDIIVVKPVKASGLYHERAMLYIDKARPLEIHRYHYKFWSKPPADLIYEALYQGLKTSGVAVNVNRQISGSRAAYIIDSRITRFERVVDGEDVTVQVGLDVSIKSASDRWSKHYQSNQSLHTRDIHASAEAYGMGLQTIIKQIINDLVHKK